MGLLFGIEQNLSDYLVPVVYRRKLFLNILLIFMPYTFVYLLKTVKYQFHLSFLVISSGLLGFQPDGYLTCNGQKKKGESGMKRVS